jgi:cell division transport system permease protein
MSDNQNNPVNDQDRTEQASAVQQRKPQRARAPRSARNKAVRKMRRDARSEVEFRWSRVKPRLLRFVPQLLQVCRSAFVGIRRNGPLAMAGIVCSFVALVLVGSSLLVQRGVENATTRWRGGVETILFLEPQTTPERAREIGIAITGDPIVAEARFVSQQEALEEFRVMFRNSPELVRSVDAGVLPASWRVVPVANADEAAVEQFGARWESEPSVYEVVYAKDAVRAVQSLGHMVRRVLVSVAALVALAALLLAVAACRSAAFARREELNVMRLVGAPRWVVRWPFIIEGATTGLIGGWLAAMGVDGLARFIQGRVVQSEELAIVKNFSVTSADVWSIGLQMMLLGSVLGALGAGLAVTRYVRVSEGTKTSWLLRTRNERARQERRARVLADDLLEALGTRESTTVSS